MIILRRAGARIFGWMKFASLTENDRWLSLEGGLFCCAKIFDTICNYIYSLPHASVIHKYNIYSLLFTRVTIHSDRGRQCVVLKWVSLKELLTGGELVGADSGVLKSGFWFLLAYIIILYVNCTVVNRDLQHIIIIQEINTSKTRITSAQLKH